MKSVLIAASLIASASAFAPSANVPKSSSLSMAVSNELGAMAPLGYFDPLKICTDGNQENFDRLRYVELKHGRVAMLAVVGYLTTYAGIRFPGAEDIPAGFAALPALPGMVWAQMVATWAMMEMANSSKPAEINGFTPEFMGDFRNGALDFGWDKQSDEWKRKKRSIELNQGRAAQMGILGLMGK